MISRRVAINLGAFFVVAILLVVYGVLNLFGNPLDHHDQMTVRFPTAGGLHPDFLVSLDGVPVGTVKRIALEPGKGVKVTLSIDKGKTIPSDVEARIVRSSAVGEQRIDLVPTHNGEAPPLKDHAVIKTATEDAVPPDVNQVVDDVNRFLGSLPTDKLNGLVHEAALGLAGRSDDLKSVVDSLTTLSEQFLKHQDQFRQLVDTSPHLLDALAESGPTFQQALDNTTTLTKLLADRRYDLVDLLARLGDLGEVGQKFVLSNRTNLTCIFSDLADAVDFLQGQNLQNLSTGLRINKKFFGPVDKIAPYGYAQDLGYGAPTRNDQTWLRVRVLLPPAQPLASRYDPQLSPPNTKPGAACQNVYGNGVGPVSQGKDYQVLYRDHGAKIVPPTAQDAQAPPAAYTGPASASRGGATAMKADLRSTSNNQGGPSPVRSAGGSEPLLVILGLAVLLLIGRGVPYLRYHRRS